MMKKSDIEAIERFLNDQSDYLEAERISCFLKENPEALDQFFPIDARCQATGASYGERETMLAKILGKKRAGVVSFARWAAAAIFIGLIIYGTFIIFIPAQPHQLAEAIASPQFQRVSNPSDSVVSVLLPDGSRLQLQAFSEAVYNKDFASNREVFLIKGAAFFQVQKNKESAFRVFANEIATTALGTEFWVESPVENATVTVRLQSGKVSIASGTESFAMDEVILAPGQVCVINKNTGSVKVLSPKSREAVAAISRETVAADLATDKTIVWTNESIGFKKTRLRSVLAKLETRYGVKIIAPDRLLEDIMLTGTVYNSDSLVPLLRNVCEISHLSYTIQNDTIFIRKREVPAER